MNEVVNFHVWLKYTILQQTYCRANYLADIYFSFQTPISSRIFEGRFTRVKFLKSY